MKKIREKFAISVADQNVLITHDGYNCLCNKDGKQITELKEVIKFSIEKDGNSDGFIPYNNFECSIKWSVI